MATECYSQLRFGFQPKLQVDFSGGTLTSDAGLVLLREYDARQGLLADVVRRIRDGRDRRYVTHALETLVRQRVYQIAAGYEDANDADRLRADPTFQVVAGSGTDVLGSQPTLSRWEYAVDWVSIRRLMTCGVDWFCQHAFPRRAHPRELVLDVDGTDARAHGAQQLALFNGYYRERVYHLLVWSEGTTGLPLRTRLRPGDVHGTTGLLADLGQSCRASGAAFRTPACCAAAMRGWRRRRWSTGSKPRASTMCWASGRISSFNSAWLGAASTRKPAMPARTGRSPSARVFGIARAAGRAAGASS